MVVQARNRRWVRIVVALLLAMAALPVVTWKARPAAAASPTKIMPLGDSITAGDSKFGSAGIATWRYPLWKQLTAAGYNVDFVGSQFGVWSELDNPSGIPGHTDFDQDHEGHPGYWARYPNSTVGGNFEDLYSKAAQWVSAAQPTIVLLHIGSNDIRQGSWAGTPTPTTPQSVRDSVGDVIGQIRAGKADVRIVLAKIISNDTTDAQVQQFNSLLPALVSQLTTVQSPITLVDQYTGFSVANDTLDGLHPNASGEQKMANVWYPAVTSILGAASGTVPAAPPTPTAAAGDRSAVVSWTPPTDNGNRTITSYTVTATPGGATGVSDGPGTTATVGGLTNGTQYTFTVRATNASGAGSASPPSAAVTPFSSATGSVSVRATSIADSSPTTPGTLLSPATPSGATVGDLLIGHVAIASGSGTVTPPSGWQAVTSKTNNAGVSDAVFSKVVAPDEPSAELFTVPAGVRATVGIVAYRGVDLAAAVTATAGSNTSSTSATAPATTTTVANSLVAALFATAPATAVTPPSGNQERFETNAAGLTVELSDVTVAAAGAVAAKTVTLSPAAPSVSHLIVLAPASGQPPPPPPPGTIGFRSAATGSNGAGTTSITLPRPAGVVAGDVMLAQVAVGLSGDTVVTEPAGWTVIDRKTNTSGVRDWVWFRVATAGEPASYLFTLNRVDVAVGGVQAFQGVDPANPVPDASAGAGTASSTTSPGLTLASAGAVVMLVATKPAVGVTPPSGLSERYEVAGGLTAESSDRAAAAGAVPDQTATFTGSAINVSHLVVLKAAPNSSPPPTTTTTSSSSTTSSSTTSSSTTSSSTTTSTTTPTTTTSTTSSTSTTTPGSGGVQFRSTASATNGAGSTSLTLARPTGVVSGDVLLTQIAVGLSGDTAVTDPGGWTVIDRKTNTAGIRDWVWFKVATASEPASYVFTLNRVDVAAGAIQAFSGVDPANPVPDATTGADTGSSATAPGLTVGATGAAVVLVGAKPPVGMTAPAGSTERYDIAGGVSVESSDKTVAPGALGNQTVTFTGSAFSVSHLLVLKAAPGSPPPTTTTTSTPTSSSTTTTSAPASSTTTSSSTTSSSTTSTSSTTTSSTSSTTSTTTPPGGGVVFRSVAAGDNGGSGTTVTVARPAGVVAGDVMLAQVAVGLSGDTVVTEPAGWTVIDRKTNTAGIRDWVWFKVATASEPASYVFTLNHVDTAVAAIQAFSGVDNVNPVPDATTGAGTGSSATAPGLTLSAPGSVVVLVAAKPAVAVTAPGGLTERYDQANGLTIESSDRTALSGAVPDQTATLNGSAVNVTHLVVLDAA